MPKITLKIFIERAQKVHGDNFDYSNVTYMDSKTKVSIYCKKHNEHFEQRPENHWNGAGCPKCRYEKTSLKNSNNFKFTTEQFIRKAEEVHGAKYDYSKVDYKLNSIPVTIICPEHGEFKQRPNDHTSGKKGCRSCCGFGFDKNKSAILYYLSINDGQAYKIGITNRDVSSRFNKVDLEKIKIIKTWEYPLGIDAYKKEKEILKIYSYAKYEGDPLLTDGNTELFNFDILGLIPE